MLLKQITDCAAPIIIHVFNRCWSPDTFLPMSRRRSSHQLWHSRDSMQPTCCRTSMCALLSCLLMECLTFTDPFRHYSMNYELRLGQSTETAAVDGGDTPQPRVDLRWKRSSVERHSFASASASTAHNRRLFPELRARDLDIDTDRPRDAMNSIAIFRCIPSAIRQFHCSISAVTLL